jgi:RNA polymerase sigma factor (sigma-70 family)
MLKWLIRVSERKLIDIIRAMRSKKRGGNFQKHSNRNTSYCNLIELLRAEERSPSSEEAVKEAVNIMQIALCSLPDDTRRAVELRHLDEQSNESIAKELERSVPAVKGLIQRGMRKLRLQMGSETKYFNDPIEEPDQYQQPVREAQ